MEKYTYNNGLRQSRGADVAEIRESSFGYWVQLSSRSSSLGSPLRHPFLAARYETVYSVSGRYDETN